MTRIIIFIVSGMLLLVTYAKAEIIYLNCKFESGNVDGKYRMNRGEPLTEDINVILDTGKKKIVEAPSRFKDEPDNKKINISGHEVTQYSSWSDYIIEWSNYGVTPTTGATSSYKYKLNRRSGVLEFIVFSNWPTLNQKLYTNSQFNCLKQDKKF
jgi:hypothetical protein